MRLGVIGGTGLYDLGVAGTPVDVETPYGATRATLAPLPGDDGSDVVFVQRHGDGHRTPPHRIDPRRHVDALDRCGVDAVVAINNVGGLRAPYAGDALVVPHDLVDLAQHPHATFHDDAAVHIDLGRPYCPDVRAALLAAARADAEGMTVHDTGVYVGVRGPRLETPAEVRWLATLGDVVGMTGCPEAALARERGLCYAALCYVANPAASADGGLTAAAIAAALTARAPAIARIVRATARHLGARTCTCAAAPAAGRMPAPGAPHDAQ